MKKVLFLFITAFCLLQIPAFAQKAQVGLTGGVSVSNIYGKINNLDNRGEARAGFTVGLVVDAPIKKSNISFQPGIHYVQKGKFTSKTVDVDEADALRYADILFNFVAHVGKPGATRLYFGLGPQIGLNLPSKKIQVADGDRTELRSISFGETAADDYNGIDYGFNGLAGIRFKNGITFSVNYTLGIRNIVPVKPDSKKDPLDLKATPDFLRNGALGFRVGYMFSNTPKEKKKKEKK